MIYNNYGTIFPPDCPKLQLNLFAQKKKKNEVLLLSISSLKSNKNQQQVMKWNAGTIFIREVLMATRKKKICRILLAGDDGDSGKTCIVLSKAQHNVSTVNFGGSRLVYHVQKCMLAASRGEKLGFDVIIICCRLNELEISFQSAQHLRQLGFKANNYPLDALHPFIFTIVPREQF